METIHNLHVGNFVYIDSIKYKILNIKIIKYAKCFRDYYGNGYMFILSNELNENINIVFNEKTVKNYSIKLCFD